jgi:hypothetical protein
MPCCRQLSCSFSCSSWGYALGGLLGTVLIVVLIWHCWDEYRSA